MQALCGDREESVEEMRGMASIVTSKLHRTRTGSVSKILIGYWRREWHT